MAARNGTEVVRRLRDTPRDVWIQGERVADVTVHPAFSASVQHIAALYDMQCDPATRDRLTYTVPETGEQAGMAFMPAANVDDLRRKRDAYTLWAEQNFGLMGRSPDFLSCTLLAFWEAREVFDRGGTQFGDNISNYYRHVRDHDLFLSHALVTPQNDRSKSSTDLRSLHLHVERESDAGIYVSGARMIATLGPISDELLIYSPPILRPNEDDHAIIFAVRTDATGLRQICRAPYVLAGDRSSFDHPLSTRFEENDSLLIFDKVFVPWEKVFCYRNAELSNRIYLDSAFRNHTAYQTNSRALVKFQFAVGLAIAVARSIKADQFLHVQEMLGEALNVIEFIKSGLARSEVEHEKTSQGHIRPSLPPLQSLRTFLPAAYPRIVEILQKVGAGGFMMMPSGADFLSDALSQDTARYFQGAGMGSLDRVRLFKLAWDLAGETFGSRALQYERYYAGDPVRALASFYNEWRDHEPLKLVESALRLAGEPGAEANARRLAS